MGHWDISFLQALTGLQSLSLSSNQISDISFLQALTGLQSLDLSDNKISDTSVLQALTGLQALSLGSNEISDISFLQALTGLQYLNLSSNLISDTSFLQPLTGLQFLDLIGNQISDISFVQSLNSLQSLFLGSNQISDISFLQALTNLQSLDLSYNQISDTSFLQALNGLKSLDLSFSFRVSDYSFLQALSGLQDLNLSSNRISDASFLQSVTGLQSLELNDNKISDTSFLQALTGLQSLHLLRNQITEIRNLNRLKNLRKLKLANNKITALKNLGKLPQLEEIDLSGNPITTLSDKFLYLVEQRDLKSLQLFGIQSNDLGIPPEHFGVDSSSNCLETLRGYFASLKKGTFQLKELPVILVGNSTAGKTSLRYFLQQNIFPPPDDHSTHGIEPSIWRPDDESLENLDETIKPNGLQLFFWDFGGQEYFHATHRLFFSKKAIYILVWEKKTNKQGVENIDIKIKRPDGSIESRILPVEIFPYEYWLQSIRHLAENIQQSPVILLQNKINETVDDLKENPNPELLQNNNCEALQVSIKKAYEINSRGKKDPLVDLLLQKVFSEAKTLASTLVYGAIWEDIKKMLQQVRKENIWTKEHFIQQVKLLDPDLGENSIMESYALSLHEIKSLLYFADNALLAKYVFINPGWVTEMIYHILDQPVLERNGEFDHAHVRRKTGDDYADIFIALMKKFELIFEYEESYEKEKLTKYVAPQYLPAELKDINKKIELKRRFQAFEQPGFIIGFKEFMPRYIMLRFLAAYGDKAVSKYYWKNGIAFMIEDCSVLVLSDYDKQQFRVFTENNNRYIERLVFDKLVALSENTKALSVAVVNSGLVDYTTLSEEFPGGKPSGNNTVKAISGARVALAGFNHLFEDINNVKQSDMPDSAKKPKKIKVFISYAHDDNEPKKRVDLFVKELKGQLKALEDDYDFSIFKDEQILLGEDWHNRLQQEVAEANVAILLLSSAFLQSEYISKNELGTFLEKNKTNHTCILCPIYFDPFLYRKYELLKQYQFFKPAGSTYGPKYEHLGDDLCYGDLIEFDPQSGSPLPNKNRMRYIIDFVEELEKALTNKFHQNNT